MDQHGSPDDLGRSLDDLKRYLLLKQYLPKNGGLFGSGWAQFMARQHATRGQSSQSPPQMSARRTPPAQVLPPRIVPTAPMGPASESQAQIAPVASLNAKTPTGDALPKQRHQSAAYVAAPPSANASSGSARPSAQTRSPPPPRPSPGAYSPRRPSDGFISWLFGGPVPLHGPTGKVVGYYDHQAARAGLEITGHAANLAQNVYTPEIPVGILEHVAPAAAGAVFRAIDEWIELHHPLPKFMGGPLRQELEALKVRSHRLFHAELASELRAAGHLPVGGLAGSREKWLKYFAKHPEAEKEVIEILRRVTARFDRAYGSSITPKLEKALGSAGKGKPPS